MIQCYLFRGNLWSHKINGIMVNIPVVTFVATQGAGVDIGVPGVGCKIF